MHRVRPGARYECYAPLNGIANDALSRLEPPQQRAEGNVTPHVAAVERTVAILANQYALGTRLGLGEAYAGIANRL
jgi:hypothetical protein